jgi:hypothetical protein
MSECGAPPRTQLTCKSTISPRLTSCVHRPCSIWVCRTPVLCCITAHPLSLCTFPARSAVSRDSRTATLITRLGKLFLLCWQHCNHQHNNISTPRWWQIIYLWVLHPVAYLSNWFFMTPSIATKFQYVNSL